MSDSRTVKISHKLAVAFSNENNITPTDYRIEGGYPTYLYSIKYIRSCNSIELVENCKTLFYWINRHGLLELINKSGEIDGLEIAFMDKSKNAIQITAISIKRTTWHYIKYVDTTMY